MQGAMDFDGENRESMAFFYGNGGDGWFGAGGFWFGLKFIDFLLENLRGILRWTKEDADFDGENANP